MMSEREALLAAEEYVKKQLAAMPTIKGRKPVKLSKRKMDSLVRSAASLAKVLQSA